LSSPTRHHDAGDWWIHEGGEWHSAEDWRRPNRTWQDQRVRWIAPYLKGPDVAAMVERDYELVARNGD
jgi:hypothetical protein